MFDAVKRLFVRDEKGQFASTAGSDADAEDGSGIPGSATLTAKMKEGMKPGPRAMGLLTVDGKQYLVKVGPFMKGRVGSKEEALSATLGRESGVDMKAAAIRHVNGGDAVVTEFLPNAKALGDMPEQDRAAAMQAIPKVEIEKQALFDYLVGNTDQNESNYLVEGSRFIGHDKEHALDAEDKPGTAVSTPTYLRHVDPTGTGGYGFQFEPGTIEKMIGEGEKIAGKLDKMNHRATQGVRDRVAILKAFAKSPDHSAVTLDRLGKMGLRK